MTMTDSKPSQPSTLEILAYIKQQLADATRSGNELRQLVHRPGRPSESQREIRRVIDAQQYALQLAAEHIDFVLSGMPHAP